LEVATIIKKDVFSVIGIEIGIDLEGQDLDCSFSLILGEAMSLLVLLIF
jgi:hypothetical protein